MKHSKSPIAIEPGLILFVLVIGAAVLTTLAQGLLAS